MDGKIVIMDYSPYDREKIKHILDKTGSFNIIEIASYNEFKHLHSTLIDIKLAILDINFPLEKDGLEILSLIRNSDLTRDIPVIIVTKADTIELKSAVFRLGVKDYIVRPYPVMRLENSIRSIVKLEKLFNYDTAGIENIRMSFDEYFTWEVNRANRTKSPLSLIIITTLKLNNNSDNRTPAEIKNKEKLFPIAAASARASLRSTDTIFINKGRDIIIVLPYTGEEGSEIVCKKLKEHMLYEFRSLDTEQNECIYPVHVTYPDDGNNFQALMECAFGKVSMKEMLERITSISTDTRKYANHQYNRFRRWY